MHLYFCRHLVAQQKRENESFGIKEGKNGSQCNFITLFTVVNLEDPGIRSC